MNILFLLAGLAMLIGGADILIRGISRLARRLGVPPLVIGLTVVAFGTSTPEIAINVMSASAGQTDLAFGNIVGSCLVNIGFVLALTAILRPLAVEPSIISREMPMMILAVLTMTILCLDPQLTGAATAQLTRQDGLVVLLLFGVFLYYTVHQLIARKQSDAFVDEVSQVMSTKAVRPPVWPAVAQTLGGLAGVAIGGRLVVGSAVKLALAMGIPESVVGLTIVSLGTTLPELVTGITAARRGLNDIAVGNVVGSNIFNLLFIGGLVPVIHPAPVPPGGMVDLLALLVISTLLLPIAMRGPRKITRGEGATLLLIYVAYGIWRLG